MSHPDPEQRHDRFQVHVAAGFCVGVAGQVTEEILVLAGSDGWPDRLALLVGLAGWLWVVFNLIRMARLSRRDDGSWLETLQKDERSAAIRAKAIETGFATALVVALAGMIASAVDDRVTVDFVGSTVIGASLAVTAVRFAIENR